MRVTYIVHKFSIKKNEFKIYTLAKKMRKLGFDVSIITSKINNKEKNGCNNIPIYRLRSLDFKNLFIKTNYPYIFGIKDIIRKIEPDIVHAQSHLFLSTYNAVMASSEFNISSIVSVHGFKVKRGIIVNAIQKIYLTTIAKRIFKKASIIHCLNQYEANIVKSFYPKANIVIIPNGIDTVLFKPSKEKLYNQITWVGRMVKEKGLIYLLKAIEIVCKNNPQIKLTLIGDGPLRPEIEKYIIDKKLNDNINLLGWQSGEKVAKILSKSSIFILPSLSEGMPRALLEAMSSGNAIIATNIPQIREIIKHGVDGLLINPGDYISLAKYIIWYLNNKKIVKKFAERARKKIIKNYSLDMEISRLESLYKSLAN